MPTEDTLSFFQSPPGQVVRQWESRLLDGMVEHILGDRALQVGMPLLDTLRANGMKEHWLLLSDSPLEREMPLREDWHLVAALPEALPFANETFDLVVLPHSLDFSDAPQQLLAEAVRVLAPEGRLILAGFNTLGLWWWRQQFVRFGFKPYLPANTNPIALSRIKDWLALLGLQIFEGHFGIYRPAKSNKISLNKWAWLDKAGDRWLPQLSNLYMFQAKKTQLIPPHFNFSNTKTPLYCHQNENALPN